MAASALAPGQAFAQPATSAAPSRPAPVTVAVDHFKEAVDLFGRGETAAACRKFEQSYAEGAAPGTLYNMAVCHEREGRVADAYREYDDLASRALAFGLTAKAATVRARADTLLPKLSRVDLVHRSDAVAAITGIIVDGTPFLAEVWEKPLYLAPGRHVIGIQHADGVSVTRTTAVLVAGRAQRIEMEDPAPPRPRETAVNTKKRVASYVTGGAGVAFVAAGAVLGALAISKKNDFDALCPDNGCRTPGDKTTAVSDRGTARTEAALSTVGFAVGGAALATAVYLLVTSREAAPVTAAWNVTPATDGHGAGVLLGRSF